MFKLSTAIVAASLAFASVAQAGSQERVNRVLSLLGERGVEDVQIKKQGDRTIMRGVQNGRVVEVVVRREDSDYKPLSKKVVKKKAAPKPVKKVARLPENPSPKPAPAPATEKKVAEEPRLGDGVRRDTGVQEQAPAPQASEQSAPANRPTVDLGGIRDMAKGLRSGPAQSPAR